MADAPAEILISACRLDAMRVETSDGRFLGHVFDLRCRWQAGSKAAPVLDQIVYGRAGLLERVGLRRMKTHSVHWYLVEAIRDDAIIVAASKR
jgi:sporulation protein YlmC with PRC-barrel domain